MFSRWAEGTAVRSVAPLQRRTAKPHFEQPVAQRTSVARATAAAAAATRFAHPHRQPPPLRPSAPFVSPEPLRHADAHHFAGPPCLHSGWLPHEERKMVRGRRKSRDRGIGLGHGAPRSQWSLHSPSDCLSVVSPCRSWQWSERYFVLTATALHYFKRDVREHEKGDGGRTGPMGFNGSQPTAPRSSCSPSLDTVQSLPHATLLLPPAQRRELYGKERGHLLVADMAVEFEPDKLVIDIRSRSTGQTRLLKAPTERVRNKKKAKRSTETDGKRAREGWRDASSNDGAITNEPGAADVALTDCRRRCVLVLVSSAIRNI